ncbi:MAG: hypothetical protein J6Y37_00140 [Paludibacteraceae bacterium]|nr:hypothetical protein [Paludibacteraceae bacterium]
MFTFGYFRRVIALIFVLVSAVNLEAKTLYVTTSQNIDNEGNVVEGSLYYAINDLCTLSGSHTIEFLLQEGDNIVSWPVENAFNEGSEKELIIKGNGVTINLNWIGFEKLSKLSLFDVNFIGNKTNSKIECPSVIDEIKGCSFNQVEIYARYSRTSSTMIAKIDSCSFVSEASMIDGETISIGSLTNTNFTGTLIHDGNYVNYYFDIKDIDLIDHCTFDVLDNSYNDFLNVSEIGTIKNSYFNLIRFSAKRDINKFYNIIGTVDSCEFHNVSYGAAEVVEWKNCKFYNSNLKIEREGKLTNNYFYSSTALYSIGKTDDNPNPKNVVLSCANGLFTFTGEAGPFSKIEIYRYYKGANQYRYYADSLIAMPIADENGKFTAEIEYKDFIGFIYGGLSFAINATYDDKYTSNFTICNFNLSDKIYVKKDGAGDGSSWDKAMSPDLFAAVLPFAEQSTTFHIAEGDYSPIFDADKALGKKGLLYQINEAVTIIGGYSPKELDETAVSDPLNYHTVFTTDPSGDNVYSSSSNTLKDPSGDDVGSTIGLFLISGASKVTFDGVEFEGCGTTIKGDYNVNVVLSKCSFKKTHRAVERVKGLEISDCSFSEMTIGHAPSTMVAGVNGHLDMRNSTVSGLTASAGFILSADYEDHSATGMTLINNTFVGNNYIPTEGYNGLINCSAPCEIYNNTIINCPIADNPLFQVGSTSSFVGNLVVANPGVESLEDIVFISKATKYGNNLYDIEGLSSDLKSTKLEYLTNFIDGEYVAGTFKANLAKNGGFTTTVALTSVNDGNGTDVRFSRTSGVDKDQRGVERQSKTCVGAFEKIQEDPKFYYVKLNGKGDGSNWDNAMGPEQFNKTVQNCPPGSKFYVAEGDYQLLKVNEGDDCFTLRNDVSILGGFSDQLEGTDKATNVAKNITRIRNSSIFLTKGINARFSGLEFSSSGICSNSNHKLKSLHIDSCSFNKNSGVLIGNKGIDIAISNSKFEDYVIGKSCSGDHQVLSLNATNVSIINSSFINIEDECYTSAYVLRLEGDYCTIENSTFANIKKVCDLIYCSSAYTKFNNNTCVGLDVVQMGSVGSNYQEFCGPRITGKGEMVGNIMENTSEYGLTNITTSHNNIFIPRFFQNPGFSSAGAESKNIYIKEEELNKLISGSLTPKVVYDHDAYIFSPKIDCSGFLPVVRLINDKLSNEKDIRFALNKTSVTTDQRGITREDPTCPGACELLPSEKIDRNATDYYVTTTGKGNGSDWEKAMSFETFADFVPEANKGVTFHFGGGEYTFTEDIKISNDITLIGGYSTKPTSETEKPSSCGTNTKFSLSSNLEFGEGLKKVNIKNISFGEEAGINIPNNSGLMLYVDNCTLNALTVENADEIHVTNSTLLTNAKNYIDLYAQYTYVESCYINSEGLIIHDHFKFRSHRNTVVRNSTIKGSSAEIFAFSYGSVAFCNNTVCHYPYMIKDLNTKISIEAESGAIVGNILNTKGFVYDFSKNETVIDNIVLEDSHVANSFAGNNIFVEGKDFDGVIEGTLEPQGYAFTPKDNGGCTKTVKLLSSYITDDKLYIRYHKNDYNLWYDQRGEDRKTFICPGSYELPYEVVEYSASICRGGIYNDNGFEIDSRDSLGGDYEYYRYEETSTANKLHTLKLTITPQSCAIDLTATEFYVKQSGNGNGSSWKNAMSPMDFVGMLPSAAEGATFHVAAGEYDFYELTNGAYLQKQMQGYNYYGYYVWNNKVNIIGGYPEDPEEMDVPSDPKANSTVFTNSYFCEKTHIYSYLDVKAGSVKNITFDRFMLHNPSVVEGCTFFSDFSCLGNNRANHDAISIDHKNGTNYVKNSTFSGDYAYVIISSYDDLIIEGCTFDAIDAHDYVVLSATTGSLKLYNNTFANNSVYYDYLFKSTSPQEIINNTFVNNSNVSDGYNVFTGNILVDTELESREGATITDNLVSGAVGIKGTNAKEIEKSELATILDGTYDETSGKFTPNLKDNGGLTKTVAIVGDVLPNEKSIRFELSESTVTTDQRGETRLDPTCPGAYEYLDGVEKLQIVGEPTVKDNTCSTPNSKVAINVSGWTEKCSARIILNGRFEKPVEPVSVEDGVALFELNALGNGEYVFEATNNINSTIQHSFELSFIEEPSIRDLTYYSKNSVSCIGSTDATAVLVLSGGNQTNYKFTVGSTVIPFNYMNRYTIDNLGEGTYVFTYSSTEAGCEDKTEYEFNVTVGNKLKVEGVGLDITCPSAKGQAEITISDGSSAYDVSLTDEEGNEIKTTSSVKEFVMDGLTPGVEYTLKVVDVDDCVSTFNLPIVSNLVVSKPSIKRTAGNLALKCIGDKNGSATYTVSGGNSNYGLRVNGGSWLTPQEDGSFLIDNLKAGTYKVEYLSKTGDCDDFDQDEFTVTEPTTVMEIASNVEGAYCTEVGGSITVDVTGGETPYTYQWTDGEGEILTQVGNTVTGLLPEQKYSVKVTDGNGCVAEEKDIEMIWATVPEFEFENPGCSVVNPTCYGKKGAISVPYPDYTGDMNLVAYAGEKKSTYDEKSNCLVISDLAPGTYDVKLGFEIEGCELADHTLLVEGSVVVGAVEKPALTDNNEALTIRCEGSTVTETIHVTNYDKNLYTWTLAKDEEDITATVKPTVTVGEQTAFKFTGLVQGAYVFSLADGCGNNWPFDFTVTENLKAPISIAMGDPQPYTCADRADGSLSFVVSSWNAGDKAEIKKGEEPIEVTPVEKEGKAYFTLNECGAGVYSISITDVCENTASKEFDLTAYSKENGLLTVAAEIYEEAANCEIGKRVIKASASGGTAPYVYAVTKTDGTEVEKSDLLATSFESKLIGEGKYKVSVTDKTECTAVYDGDLTIASETLNVVLGELEKQPQTCYKKSNTGISVGYKGFNSALAKLRLVITEKSEAENKKTFDVYAEESTGTLALTGFPTGTYDVKVELMGVNGCEMNNGTLLEEVVEFEAPAKPLFLEDNYSMVPNRCEGQNEGRMHFEMTGWQDGLYSWCIERNGHKSETNTHCGETLRSGVVAFDLWHLPEGQNIFYMWDQCQDTFYTKEQVIPAAYEEPLTIDMGETKAYTCLDRADGSVTFVASSWDPEFNAVLKKGDEVVKDGAKPKLVEGKAYFELSDQGAGVYTLSTTDYCKRTVEKEFDLTAYSKENGLLTVAAEIYEEAANCEIGKRVIKASASGGTAPYVYTITKKDGTEVEKSDLLTTSFESKLIGEGEYKVSVTDKTECTAVYDGDLTIASESLNVVLGELEKQPQTCYRKSNTGISVEYKGFNSALAKLRLVMTEKSETENKKTFDVYAEASTGTLTLTGFPTGTYDVKVELMGVNGCEMKNGTLLEEVVEFEAPAKPLFLEDNYSIVPNRCEGQNEGRMHFEMTGWQDGLYSWCIERNGN